MAQVGLGLCACSNDMLFVKLKHSPIKQFHERGLKVCLGTDDPMQFHHTETPLIEEFGIASQHFSFTLTDKCEIARNTVLNSCFDAHTKREWLGMGLSFARLCVCVRACACACAYAHVHVHVRVRVRVRVFVRVRVRVRVCAYVFVHTCVRADGQSFSCVLSILFWPFPFGVDMRKHW